MFGLFKKKTELEKYKKLIEAKAIPNMQKQMMSKNRLMPLMSKINTLWFWGLVLLTSSLTLNAQDDNSEFDFYFDHESLVVTNLMKTGDFYRDVLKLKEIPHPDNAPGFRWFKIRGNAQLHLIKKEVVAFKKDKSIHLSLSTQNLEAVIMHLIEKDIDFYNWPGEKGSVSDRSDGVKQIYIQDPDGYWVEINTAAHSKSSE